MIHVIATIKVNEEGWEKLVEAFRGILPTVRRKNGCLEYGLAVDVESGLPGQVLLEEKSLVIVEKWSDLDALNAHITDPEYRAWFDQVEHLIEDASMQILTALE